MTISLNLSRHEAPREFAEVLSRVQQGDPITVEVDDVGLCPNRIVPVVGIADEYLSRGFNINFIVKPHSAGEAALAGVITREINPKREILEAFGRVWRFDNADDQGLIVNAMVLELDKSANLARGVKQCFEWCLNEVTDNVLNHSSPEGHAHGYVMVQYVKNESRLKICVFDLGIGLKSSFIGSKYSPKDSAEAIRYAVGKGVTNGKGQGNGLWGLHEMVKIGNTGKLHIRSDGAEYLFSPGTSVESTRNSWTLPGFGGTTTVDFQMVCTSATSLQDIFGSDYVSVDLWQENHEKEEGVLELKVSELVTSYGTRESARRVRHVVENAIDNDHKRIILDFINVGNCSSSFIDELLVKLMVKYGPATYGAFFSVTNLSGLPACLANFSMGQRLCDTIQNLESEIGSSIGGVKGQMADELSYPLSSTLQVGVERGKNIDVSPVTVSEAP